MTTEKNSLDTKVLLEALVGFKNGDFAVRLPMDWAGVDGKIADTFNEIASLNEQTANGLDRISQVVGKEGKISQRMRFGEEKGGWRRIIESINTLIDDMVQPTKEIARVIAGVAKGDLSQSMPLEVEGTPLSGEFLKTAKTVNTMISQLSTFSLEVTRVAREVGTEGILGGQAEVKGVPAHGRT